MPGYRSNLLRTLNKWYLFHFAFECETSLIFCELITSIRYTFKRIRHCFKKIQQYEYYLRRPNENANEVELER